MTRMYREAKKTINWFVGCNYGCVYCVPSFQKQAKRRKKACLDCYYYKPHNHPERLYKPIPRTKEGEFIFLNDMGDVSFCDPDYMRIQLKRIEDLSNRTFLIQSKNPEYFHQFNFPNNVVLGITLETNRDEGYEKISKAPLPSKRFEDFLAIEHSRKIVTVEPILEFDLETLASWIFQLNPCRVYIGFDSHPKKNKLPEPSQEKADKLYGILKTHGIDVRWK